MRPAGVRKTGARGPGRGPGMPGPYRAADTGCPEGSRPLGGAQRAPPASKAGPLMRLFALQGQTLFAPQFRSAQPWAHAHNPAPPRGVGDAALYNTIRRASHYRKRPRRPGGRPPYIPLYHIPWGGPSPATHSRHPVGAGHARPATLPLPPRILCIVGRQAHRAFA